jgi:hypothetical protein
LLCTVSFGFALLTVVMRFGYNSAHFLSFAVSDSDFARILAFIGISVAVELLNLLALDRLFFAPRRLSLLPRLYALLSQPEFFFSSMLWWATIMETTGLTRVLLTHIR